ncbi:hypothetical protein G4B88_030454 [Cannabis sativa]|uniref:Uncharacterized protein n=1 Tax=Cannabis sativa TaxID=3483 RepID=A0A7J6F6J3_CANSA|nr:hypothetical protein G4B88_030454 [Cannabis sativa]
MADWNNSFSSTTFVEIACTLLLLPSLEVVKSIIDSSEVAQYLSSPLILGSSHSSIVCFTISASSECGFTEKTPPSLPPTPTLVPPLLPTPTPTPTLVPPLLPTPTPTSTLLLPLLSTLFTEVHRRRT